MWYLFLAVFRLMRKFHIFSQNQHILQFSFTTDCWNSLFIFLFLSLSLSHVTDRINLEFFTQPIEEFCNIFPWFPSVFVYGEFCVFSLWPIGEFPDISRDQMTKFIGRWGSAFDVLIMKKNISHDYQISYCFPWPVVQFRSFTLQQIHTFPPPPPLSPWAIGKFRGFLSNWVTNFKIFF